MTNSSGPMKQPQSSQGDESPSSYLFFDVISYLGLRAVHAGTKPILRIPFSIFKACETHQHEPGKLETEFQYLKSAISLKLGAEVVNDTNTVTSHDDSTQTGSSEQAKELRQHLASMLVTEKAFAQLPGDIRKHLDPTLASRLQASQATLRGRADAQHSCDGSAKDTELKQGIRTVEQGVLGVFPAVKDASRWLWITHVAPRYASGATPTEVDIVSDKGNTLVIFPRSTSDTEHPVDVPGIRLTFHDCDRCDIEPVNRVSKPGLLSSIKMSMTRNGGYREGDWESSENGLNLAVCYSDPRDDDEEFNPEVRPKPAKKGKADQKAPRTAPLPKGVTLR